MDESGEIALEKLSGLIKSGAPLTWWEYQGLASSVAASVKRQSITRERLLHMIEEFVPEMFQSAAVDWLGNIGDEDLPDFVKSLLYSMEDLRQHAEEASNMEANDRRKSLILYIEDDPGARKLIQLVIARRLGERISVFGLGDGAGGLILASMLLPDLIMIDVTLPGMWGFEVAKQLKKNPLTQNVPFIFLTYWGLEGAAKMGMELGAKGYWTMPIGPNDLLAVLREVMGIEE